MSTPKTVIITGKLDVDVLRGQAVLKIPISLELLRDCDAKAFDKVIMESNLSKFIDRPGTHWLKMSEMESGDHQPYLKFTYGDIVSESPGGRESSQECHSGKE